MRQQPFGSMKRDRSELLLSTGIPTAVVGNWLGYVRRTLENKTFIGWFHFLFPENQGGHQSESTSSLSDSESDTRLQLTKF